MIDRRILTGLVLLLALGLVSVPLMAPGRAADDTRTFSESGFEKVRLEGAFTTDITAGAAHTRVEASGDSGTLDRITTKIEGDTLVIGMHSGTSFFARSPRITIELPALYAFTNDGAGSTKIGGLRGNDVEITNSGAGSIVAAGRAGDLRIALNGTGKIDTTGIDAHDVTVDNNGVGSIDVRASGKLTASVNGVGSIRYTGNPSNVQSQVNGIGHIGRL
jgi:hypothetical protein